MTFNFNFSSKAYWSQLFLIPTKVLKLVEAQCKSYLWSGTNTITKKSLVAWERICTPVSVGGLNLINIGLWNKAAIAKITWDLANKQDKLWIKWIHAYYIKAIPIHTIQIPAQASWMVRKIIAAGRILSSLHIIQQPAVSIKTIYLKLLVDNARVNWRTLMYDNNAKPKDRFTMWLQIQNRLLTKDRLQKWGMDVDQECKFCQCQLETRDHLFLQCTFAQQIWRKAMSWIQRQWNPTLDWEDHLEWVIASSKGRSTKAKMFKMVYAEVIYGLWTERNMRNFENKRKQWQEIVREIASICNERAKADVKNRLQQLML